MSLAPDISTPAASDLHTVSVVSFSKNDAAQLWIDALGKNGAEMLKDRDVESLQDITRQKLAVILDQDISPAEMEIIIQKYETIHASDTTRSLRFFACAWNKNISNDADRLRIIDIMNIAPNAFPARVNRALFKSRLPGFLRKNYDVDISDTLEEIDEIHYRPIMIRSHKKEQGKKTIEYETAHLYIHDKKLYLKKTLTGPLVEIQEEDKVLIRKQHSRIAPQFAPLTLLKDETEEE